jgi:hypothetical protein
MRLHKATCAAVCLIALSACSTTPVSYENAKQVPPDRLYALQEPSGSDSAKLIVTRDSGAFGSACYVKLFLDGKKAADFGTSETATFYHAPGEIVAEISSGICGSGNKEVGVLMKPGETRKFRIYVDSFSGYGFSPTTH